ncbi:CPBP family intramembrane metalloprotease [Bacteroides fragilis]|uniref:CPBP family intramembrane glutamic endopeptidase n=2 Tax=Bacteroides TaxID=816 RepID=UPI00202DBCE2|nr:MULTISPECIES: CPBP family intramembrane glutamic endopeptidase [Bacteroides]MCZ2696798.1 CPBP family intramembrane metalloprotease [Bacteroides fragilis]MDV6185550.1 CPBP family intramembrane glutamic endopeptidase [Bacteroides hominis (ex Liu et al. 2022)]
MYIVIGFIDFISKDISLIKKEFFTFPRLIYGLVLIPVLEELSCRIIIINKFKDKLNQWIIIIMTALYFGMLHAGSIYTVIGLSCFGFVLAYLYIKSGNGLLLILCHFFYNAINFCSYSIFWSVTSRASNYIYNPIHYIIVAISIMYIIYFFTQKKYI